MKNRKFTKLIAIVLSLTFFFSAIGMTTASAAIEPGTNPLIDDEGSVHLDFLTIIKDFLDSIIRYVLEFFSGLFPDNDKFQPDTDKPEVPENFYSGTGTSFKTSADRTARWNLGYASESLVPEDYDSGEYYIGGYIDGNNLFTNVVEDVVDDMRVRCIALNDGTSSGTALFGVIDCIGITNNDIRDIRALLKDFAQENNIAVINIASTHCHSCIDTEGLWTKNIYKILVNAVASGTGSGEELLQGTNENYMKFLKATVAETLKKAYADLKPGELTYSIKDIGDDYFNNKNRPSATALMTELSRFIFTPDEKSAKPTMIINIAAHPDVAGLPTGGENTGRKISGDYVYYLDEYIQKAGYNCMFFQGAIAGIYMSRGASNDNVDLPERWQQSRRFGYEIARMALSLNLTVNDIENGELKELLNPVYFDRDALTEDGEPALGAEGYSVWYEGWTPVGVVRVEPFLNIAMKNVEVEVSNDLIEAAGKLNLANYSIYVTTAANGKKTYSVISEVGYMELGNQFKTVFLPGEVCQDLVVGGESLFAGGSISGKDFGYPTVIEIFGFETKCFGLMNDAVGYIVPDNDFTMGDPANHYHELISIGQNVASSCIKGLVELNDSISR